MQKFFNELEEFLSSPQDRLSFLQKKLSEAGLETSVIQLKNKNHLFINFPSYSFNPQFKIRTIISHYDIVKDSKGANDNSAACLMLINFAKKILERAKKGKFSNIRIWLTDGEEDGINGVSEQGSFELAEYLKEKNLQGDEVFVFDSCGRGTIPILAQSGLLFSSKNKSTVFARQFSLLYKKAIEILKNACPKSWMTLPVPYSDNAGLLAQGIPCVQLTFLPKDEATLYYNELLKDKNLEKAVMNSTISSDNEFKFKYQEKLPYTWKLFHTKMDNILSLTKESFPVLEKIFDELLIPEFNS